MRSKKSPQIKKQDSYDKDHRTLMENPHAFRKNWKKKKTLETRRDRVALRTAFASDDAENLSPTAIAKLREKQPIKKCGVSTLRSRVKLKKMRSLRRLLANAKGPSPHRDLMNDRPRGRELI